MPEEIWRIRLEAESNLAQLRSEIEQTRRSASQLSGGTERRTPMTFAQQDALRAAKDQAVLTKAQEQAAVSMMSSADKAKYYRNELSQLTPGTLQYAQTQTKLGNELNKTSDSVSRVTSLMTKMALSMIVWEGFRAVTQSIGEVIDKQREYSLETARFAAITDQSVSEATDAWNRFADIGIEAGVKPSQMGGTMRTAQLAKGTEEEKNQYVETVAKLSEVTGAQTDTISKSIYSVLQQADMGLGEVSKLGDQVIATLQKMPNIEIEQVFAAMQEAPSLAKLWGTSFEDAFNIIVEGAARAQESPEQMATSFQRLSQGINSLSEGGADAYERIKKLRDVFSFDVAPGGKMLPMLDVMKMAAEKLPELDSTKQQEFLQALSGGSIRPEQMRNLIGGIDAFTIKLGQSFDKLTGTLDEAAAKMEGSWGQINAKLEAGIEKLKMTGDIGQNLIANILKSTVGQLGAQGAEFVNTRVEAMNLQGLFGKKGAVQQNKEEFLKSLTGMTPDDAIKAVEDYNYKLSIAYNEAQLTDPFNFGLNDILQKGKVTNDEALSAIASNSGKKTGKGFMDGLNSILGNIKSVFEKATSEGGEKAVEVATSIVSGGGRTFPGGIVGQLAQEEYTTAFRRGKSGEATGLTGESVLDRAGTLDATKYTQDEISQAKQLAVQLAQQELDAERAFYEQLGLTSDEIDMIIQKRQEEIDKTITLVRTQEGMKYELGAQAKYLQDALRLKEQQDKESKSDFQFRRLKDIDPSQFGQLQALTQMYDKFLTNIGSPEKKQNINLLLGEQNVFKTMNGRMTALQLALEDLTKVEKAQLSGTWNLPAGATAMVPISSLDLQRWNKAAGGGIDPAALAALMNATAGAGDQTSESMQTAATRIIAALHETFTKQGLSTEKIDKAKTPAEAVKAARDTFQERVDAMLLLRDKAYQEMSKTLGGTHRAEDYPDYVARHPDLTGQRQMTKGQADAAKQTLSVTVSSTPVKANLMASVSVVLNGNIVARAIVPFLYDMLIKQFASSGLRTNTGTRRGS